MRGVRFASSFSRISGIASFSLAGVFAKVMPLKQEGSQLVEHGRSSCDQPILLSCVPARDQDLDRNVRSRRPVAWLTIV
jgi:hypothetical protein